MINYFKQRKLRREFKNLEEVTKMLLATPNISYKSQLEMIEKAHEIWQEKQHELRSY